MNSRSKARIVEAPPPWKHNKSIPFPQAPYTSWLSLHSAFRLSSCGFPFCGLHYTPHSWAWLLSLALHSAFLGQALVACTTLRILGLSPCGLHYTPHSWAWLLLLALHSAFLGLALVACTTLRILGPGSCGLHCTPRSWARLLWLALHSAFFDFGTSL